MTNTDIALQIGAVVVAMDRDRKLPRRAKQPYLDALMELAMAAKFEHDREIKELEQVFKQGLS
jgi:hypothetical protein